MAVKERIRGGVKLNVAELKSALQVVKKAVSARAVKPVLANVRIGDGRVSATDLEVRLDVDIDYHGDAMLLPHGRLLAILNAAGSDEVTFTPKGATCVVSRGDDEWTLPTEDAAEFPSWEPENLKARTQHPAEQLARAIFSVVAATDNESSRYTLGVVLIEVAAEGKVSLVATDGRRLHLAAIENDVNLDPSQTLLPARAAGILHSLASDGGQEMVEIDASDREVVCTCGGVRLTARLVEGRFPPWRTVLLPSEEEPTVVLASDLESATDAAAIVTSEQSKGVTYTFTDGCIRMTAESAEAGKASVTCKVEKVGHECSVVLDPAYVREWLRCLPKGGDPVVTLTAKDKGSAVVMRSDDTYTGVIMPLDTEA
jgi:DNA polymerase-3 subunit beta